MTDFQLDPKFIGGVDLLKRAGVRTFRIGHTDEEEDGAPVIWHVTAIYGTVGTEPLFQVAAGRDPVQAVMRLCEVVVDGAHCAHCGERSIFVHDDLAFDETIKSFGLDACVYAWDPELKTFRRGCE